MVSFKDLSSDAGLNSLNNHLATRSYIEGYQASSADIQILSQIHASIDNKKYPHAARWLNHITSFSPLVRAKFGGGASASTSGAAAHGGKAAKNAEAEAEGEDEDDFMTSLSDDDDDGDADSAAQALIAKKNAEREAAKKKEKGGPVAKSSLILDVKPEDSDTDLQELVKKIKAIEMQGLTWGNYELIPVAYGIKKIRIICVVIDDEVSTDDLQEAIEQTEGVQSTDIHAFNKL